MTMSSRYILGIDTSNYKTSLAVVDDSMAILCDIRRFLKVKQGEKGLRQSDALFQHVRNLPEMMKEMRQQFNGEFLGVAYSSRPRPVEGSYMPVFLAGKTIAESLGAAMNIPVMEFSHQEGHIEAVKYFSDFRDEKSLMVCHFSGGTTELLRVDDNTGGYDISIIGGTKDISFGQVLDRAGVTLRMEFPAGRELDDMAVSAKTSSGRLTTIKVKDAFLNLSGIDTQINRTLKDAEAEDISMIIRELFEKLSSAMAEMIIQGASASGITKVIMAGGVSSSRFIRKYLDGKLKDTGITAVFNDNGLAQDNAVGTALLGGRKIWR